MTSKTRYFMGGSAAVLVAGLGTGLVAYYGGGFPSLSASRTGPSELSYVPADAAVVAFANVREVMDSQLRLRLKQVLPQEQGQKEFQQQTGIDIEHDIDYVVAAMTAPGADTARGSGLALPYAAQYEVSTLLAKRHDVSGVPRPAWVPNPVASGNEKP